MHMHSCMLYQPGAARPVAVVVAGLESGKVRYAMLAERIDDLTRTALEAAIGGVAADEPTAFLNAFIAAIGETGLRPGPILPRVGVTTDDLCRTLYGFHVHVPQRLVAGDAGSVPKPTAPAAPGSASAVEPGVRQSPDGTAATATPTTTVSGTEPQGQALA